MSTLLQQGIATIQAHRGEELLEYEIQRRTPLGWEVVNRSPTTVQMRKLKRWPVIGTLLFVALPALLGCAFLSLLQEQAVCLWLPLWGLTLFGLLATMVDYLNSAQLVYITTEQLVQQEIDTQAQAMLREQNQAEARARRERFKAGLKARWRALGRSGQISLVVLLGSGCLFLIILGSVFTLIFRPA